MSRFLPPLVSALCVSAALVLGLSLSTPLLSSIRTGLGLTLVYFIPGLIWTYVFWPAEQLSRHPPSATDDVGESFPFIHRFILAFLFSIVLTPLGLLVANRFHVPIVTTTIYKIALGIIVAGVAASWLRYHQRGNLKS